ncbi:MAG: Fur family transcriptional regulator [Nitrospirota bacterium]
MRKSAEKHKLEDKKQRLKTFLKEKGFKSTRQRDIIANEFFNSKGHITAEDLYRKIIKKHRDIGFTTVYRTLKLLVKSGLATERVFTDNLTRYEPLSTEDHHDHLICLNCGAITEFEDMKMEKLQEHIANKFGFETIIHRMEIYGYCKKCKSSKSPTPFAEQTVMRL